MTAAHLNGLTRRRVLAGLSALGATTASGCGILSTGDDDLVGDGPNDTTGTSSMDPADQELLVIASGDTDGKNVHSGDALERYEFDGEADTYKQTGRRRPEDGTRPVTDVDAADTDDADDRWYVVVRSDGQESTLEVLDDWFEVTASTTLQGRHTLAIDDDHVVTASEYGCYTFDRELEPVGRDELDGGFETKHMEDLLVHDGVAYVVDNEIYPVYLFRIDVEDPADPEYLELVSVIGVGTSLGQQWLDPAANAWQFLRTTSHRGGTEQDVVTTPMEDADAGSPEPGDPWNEDELVDFDVREERELRSEQVYSWDRMEETEEGTQIEDVTDGPPVYATVRETDGRHHLAAISVDYDADPGSEEDVVAVDAELELDGPARVDHDGGAVVTLVDAEESTELTVFDPEAGAVVHDQTVDLNDPLELLVVGR